MDIRLQPYLTALMLFISAPLFSQTMPLYKSKEFRFTNENDALFSDHYYSNGLRFELQYNYDPAIYQNGTPDDTLFHWPIYKFNSWLNSTPENIYHGLRFGQDLYTPTNIQKTEVVPGDHPYSAYAFAGGFLGAHHLRGQSEIEQQFSLDFGGLGRNANGGPAQKIVHDYISPQSPHPQGWGQLEHAESTVQLGYRYRRLYGADSLIRAGYEFNANLGNVGTNASLGLLFRVGKSEVENGSSHRSQFYFFINPTLHLVAYNGHLQGGASDNRKTRVKNYDFLDFVAFSQLIPDADPLRKIFYYQNLIETTNNFSSKNALNRYHLFYRPLFNPDGKIPYGVDFITFNQLFNHGEDIDFHSKMEVLGSILETGVSDPNERTLIITAFLREGKTMYPMLRLLAYENFLKRTGIILDDITKAFVYRQLVEKVHPDKSYTVKKKHYYGSLRFGFALDFRRFSLKLSSTWRSSEFEHKEEFPASHIYSSIEIGFRW